MDTQNNPAKFAFFYMLSLVALIFMALSTGMIIFQIINKFIPDILNEWSGRFNDDAIKFAISAIIISTPVFFITMRQIHKSLFSGVLNKDSGIRRWLTYLILFISSVVMIGWLIGIVNSFLGGELSTKFFLKALTAIIISAAVFVFYYYDIKREEIEGKHDKVIKTYFYATLIVVIAAFIGGLLTADSPSQTRNKRYDDKILNNFNEIDRAINDYFMQNKKLPESLAVLKNEFNYINDADISNPSTKKEYEYSIKGDKEYEICAEFLTSNKDEDEFSRYYGKDRWPHDKGRQCIAQKVMIKDELLREPEPMMIK